jgi:rSAM/selenodomain-associated transferase 1
MMTSEPQGPAVGILTRYPERGVGKTRLAAAIGEEGAFRLGRAMLLDVCEAVQGTALCHPTVFVDPADAIDATGELTVIADVRAQSGGDIGERMLAAARALESDGYRPIILVGSDLPLLDSARIHQALRALRRAEVVFGPASDGGYTLVGMQRARAALFDEVEWSTARVLDQSVAAAERAGLSYGLLSESFDVDTRENLGRLREELARRDLEGVALARNTAAALKELDALH